MKWIKIILEIIGKLIGRKKPSPLDALKKTIRKEVKDLDNEYEKMLEEQKTADADTFKSLHFRLSVNRAARTKKLAKLGAAVLYPGRDAD